MEPMNLILLAFGAFTGGMILYIVTKFLFNDGFYSRRSHSIVMPLATGAIFIGVILVTAQIIINGLEIEPAEVNEQIIYENVTTRNIDVTPSINYTNYGKNINKKYDDLYVTDMDLGLEDI